MAWGAVAMAGVAAAVAAGSGGRDSTPSLTLSPTVTLAHLVKVVRFDELVDVSPNVSHVGVGGRTYGRGGGGGGGGDDGGDGWK